MTTNEQRQLGRAKNALLAFFERRISVPKIYIDADWDGQHIDVLAIDRDGVGDVHTVLLVPRKYLLNDALDKASEWITEKELLEKLTNIPAQFKYIGVVDTNSSQHNAQFEISPAVGEKSFAQDGIGRVGFLKIDVPADGEPQVRVEIKPERFRAKIAKLADEYIQQHEADWEIRA
jgi:hypothetical protein